MLGDWPEVILKYAVGDFTADLTTIAHRVPPVQPGPNSRVIYLPRDFLQVVVRWKYLATASVNAPVKNP
jgi:hypothetical protein